uniref:Family with sequence similarity 110 member C n=1 Tax=Salarias fasciatus TaxID=181472 RepID=A0A672HQ69_SALFA
MEITTEATKILEKGPDYLRKQMELEGETKGHMSAVERLAASKQKYVKSEMVANSTQEPSSPGQVRRSSSKKRPDSLLLYRQKCELLRGSARGRKLHAARRLQRSSAKKNNPLPEATDGESESEENKGEKSTPEETQKECSSHVAADQSETNTNRAGEQHSTKGNDAEAKAGDAPDCLLKVPETPRRPGKGVSRSKSDISSRYSKNFADFDSFFKYCGLDGEVIRSLGKENFSARSDEIAINIRSVSVSTSDDGFSRHSSDSDGLLENELHKKKRQGTSVIERNARIIKWLYSCKNAKETGKKLRDLE